MALLLPPHLRKFNYRRIIVVARVPGRDLRLNGDLRRVAALPVTGWLLRLLGDVGVAVLAAVRRGEDLGEDDAEQRADGGHAGADYAHGHFDCAPVSDFNVVLYILLERNVGGGLGRFTGNVAGCCVAC